MRSVGSLFFPKMEKVVPFILLLVQNLTVMFGFSCLLDGKLVVGKHVIQEFRN